MGEGLLKPCYSLENRKDKGKTKYRRNGGLTLIEILIVLIILGVLASLAVPVYQAQIVNTHKQSALRFLGTTRGALARYYSERGTYVGASIGAVPLFPCNIDFCPNTEKTAGGQQGGCVQYFLTNVAAESYELDAVWVCGPYIGYWALSIDETGTVTGL